MRIAFLFHLLDGRVVDLAEDHQQRLERKDKDVIDQHMGSIPEGRSGQLQRDIHEVVGGQGPLMSNAKLLSNRRATSSTRLLESLPFCLAPPGRPGS